MRHAIVVSLIIRCDTGCMAQGNESLQRQCADPFDNSSTVIDLHGSGALGFVKRRVKFGVGVLGLCLHPDEKKPRVRAHWCGGEGMAGTDKGQFDLRALERVGDFTNDRAAWKRWSFVFKGHVGAASPRLLELMNRVIEIQGEITFDGLNDDDTALDHWLHHILGPTTSATTFA